MKLLHLKPDDHLIQDCTHFATFRQKLVFWEIPRRVEKVKVLARNGVFGLIPVDLFIVFLILKTGVVRDDK